MKNEFEDPWKDFPDANIDSFEMQKANSIITIHKGSYSLKNSVEEIKLVGKIVFEWLPNSGAYFYGYSQVDNKISLKADNNHNEYSILIEGLKFGEGFITKLSFGDNLKASVKGAVSQYAITGDQSVTVKQIRFSVANLRAFHGLPVKRVKGKKISTSMSRLALEDNSYILTIDKCSDFKKRKESLDERGGYIILYNGELIAKRRAVKHTDIKDVLHCLDTFLSFLNGRRTSALFIQGVHDDKVIWTDFTNYLVDSYKTVQTWPPRHSINGINELWKNFRSLWKETENKSFLTSLIHWYVESNGHSEFSEGSIILAQTALELIYNWWIIESKKILLGKDTENISASNKIRLILSQLNISTKVPVAFTHLQHFIDTLDNTLDAPEAIVYIRNAIVHSQQEKRKKLSSIHYRAKYEALQLFIWYIEMALLHILNYKGSYFNRCSKELSAAKAEEQVPWAKYREV